MFMGPHVSYEKEPQLQLHIRCRHACGPLFTQQNLHVEASQARRIKVLAVFRQRLVLHEEAKFPTRVLSYQHSSSLFCLLHFLYPT